MPVTHEEWPAEVADKEDVYDERIAPLMAQIIIICKAEKIPMFATFVYAPGDFCTTSMPGPQSDEACRRLKQCERIVYERPQFAAFTITTVPAPSTTK